MFRGNREIRRILGPEKRGNMLQKMLVHIILVALVLALLVFAVLGRSNTNEVKRDILEKQTAVLIEASPENSVLEIDKENVNGFIENIRIENGKIYVDMVGARSQKGYPFFSEYRVDIGENDQKDKFIIRVGYDGSA